MNWSEADLAAHYENLKRGDSPPQPRSDLNVKVRRSMNKLEAEYAGYLEWERSVGNIDWWAYETLKIRLADNTYYTPDFAVLRAGALEFHETKGFWREDARLKIKIAAEVLPFQFRAIRKKSVKEGGGWDVEYFPGKVNRP